MKDNRLTVIKGNIPDTSKVVQLIMLNVLSLACLVISATTSQKWPGLRTTFGVNPFGGFFHPQPRTIAEAEAVDSGWHKISPCGDGGKFLGNRYVRYFGHSLILIFDDAGYIAGSQPVVDTIYVDDSLVDLNAYQLDFFVETEAYFTTEADFNRDGKGDRLLIQVGEDPNMLATIRWYEHKCFPGMGKHVIGFYYQTWK